MKMAGYLTLFLLFLAPQALASSTNINVTTEGNSDSSVKINNYVYSNSTSTNTTSSNTHIKIESNGKVTEYNSDKPEDIELESEDGTAKVSVKNGNSSVTASPTVTDHKTNEKIEKAKEEAEKKLEEGREEKKNLFEKIAEFFQNLFKF